MVSAPSKYFTNATWAAADYERLGYSTLGDTISGQLVRELRSEIERRYTLGETDEQKRDVAYVTACPEMVDESVEAWRRRDETSLPLNQLRYIVQQKVAYAIGPIDECRSMTRPQIAVRESGGLENGSHLDGLEDGAKTKHPDVPMAIVGVYLDDIAAKADAALVLWPSLAADVDKVFARETVGEKLAAALCAVAEKQQFEDTDAVPVYGPAGHVFVLKGTVPHSNHPREVDGKRIAVYFRVYEESH
ncbi:hypothetical protein [Burkholderia sp. PAMC 26561]|uniref:hypothetical protein n=1 Tax=Burkholderia sp. PAMC 26561 TaxID=1795043 RepID=UPI00076B19EF|nr:hypothetical protein [Burkholderia sp. PAMC 26561]AME23712.1 hypothetical protein AXG89_07490 [Burkholderia sp. PAMC 26561]